MGSIRPTARLLVRVSTLTVLGAFVAWPASRGLAVEPSSPESPSAPDEGSETDSDFAELVESDPEQLEREDRPSGSTPSRRYGVRLDELEVTPDTRAPAIREYVERGIGQLAYCYQRQARVQPDLAGALTLEWTLEVGRVASVAVVGGDPSLVESDVGECATKKVKRWRFSNEAEETVRARVLFEFASE